MLVSKGNIAYDSVLIRERLKKMLGTYWNLELVDSFDNGTDTLPALRHLKPDLVVVDFKMPGLSGQKLLMRIKG